MDDNEKTIRLAERLKREAEVARQTAARLLEECGLTRNQLLQIPRLAPLSELELDRIQSGRQ